MDLNQTELAHVAQAQKPAPVAMPESQEDRLNRVKIAARARTLAAAVAKLEQAE